MCAISFRPQAVTLFPIPWQKATTFSIVPRPGPGGFVGLVQMASASSSGSELFQTPLNMPSSIMRENWPKTISRRLAALAISAGRPIRFYRPSTTISSTWNSRTCVSYITNSFAKTIDYSSN